MKRPSTTVSSTNADWPWSATQPQLPFAHAPSPAEDSTHDSPRKPQQRSLTSYSKDRAVLAVDGLERRLRDSIQEDGDLVLDGRKFDTDAIQCFVPLVLPGHDLRPDGRCGWQRRPVPRTTRCSAVRWHSEGVRGAIVDLRRAPTRWPPATRHTAAGDAMPSRST